MKVTIALAFATILSSACRSDISMPEPPANFRPLPRTASSTWLASPSEQALIDNFVKRYPPQRAAKFREALSRSDLRLELPAGDRVGQAFLDAIYKTRHTSQLAEVTRDRLRP